jgi:acyl carrier protein
MNEFDNETWQRLRTVVARTFKTAPDAVTPESALGTLPNWDSLGHLTLMMDVEKEFGICFPTEKINEPQTAGEICKLVVAIRK